MKWYNESMKVFVGLGNPGKEYIKNRHNVGFKFVEFLAKKLKSDVEFSSSSKFSAFVAEASFVHEKYLFVEPQNYMNRSGETVAKVLSFYKVDSTSLFVAHDELDIPLGKFKIQHATGPKLHNGLSSIEEKIGTEDFWRIRIGVDSRAPENKISGEDYVLQNFTHEESEQLQSVFDSIFKQLQLNKQI